ncbi:MAG TPA: aminopeptidase [Deinococcales bacterium]|nr:aminopeptidase [Deinococcales bacterium]
MNDDSTLSLEQQLEQYADIAVRVGLGLEAGQRVIIRAPVEAAPLVRLATERAYAAGARLVTVVWSDDAVTLARFKHAPRDSFEEFPEFVARGIAEHVAAGGAVLNVSANDPDLLKGQDPSLISTSQRAASRHMRPYFEALSRNAFNWTIVAAPAAAWAERVFPGDPQAIEKLWRAILRMSRADKPGAVQAWQEHIADLSRRQAHLNERRYASLRFTGPGTDLVVGLADSHKWMTARFRSAGGQDFVANMPTEEVFTSPHRERVDGTVSATRPLSYGGSLIEGIRVRFEAGRVVEAHADKGEAVLRNLLDTDDGAGRLGEVALVPHSSPISQSGLLFYETLYDENASSHIAFGRSLAFCLEGGESMSPADLAARGANDSLLHVDWMIGSREIDVDGILPVGQSEPVMRDGEWTF